LGEHLLKKTRSSMPYEIILIPIVNFCKGNRCATVRKLLPVKIKHPDFRLLSKPS